MKKFTFLSLSLGICFLASSLIGSGQNSPVIHRKANEIKAPAKTIAPKNDELLPGSKLSNNTVNTKSVLDDPVTGITRYDLQTNSSCQNHMFLYPDGTIGSVFILSHTDAFGDRGSGYNWYNGSAWGANPSARIENEKTGWPSYAPLGATGELVIAHNSAPTGLKVCTRTTRGTGTWNQTVLAGPAGATDISWPRAVTNGPTNNYIHLICVTYVAYQGLSHAILYYRSLDGGQSWETQARILDGMTASEYLDFPADTYAWAEPHGDTLCFVVGDSWNDQFIMKSVDNGDTWTKTVIWPCPYNLYNTSDSVPLFYCPDGSNAITLDKNGNAHVVFGLQRASAANSTTKYWYPFTDGLIYWNENMPQLPVELNPDTLYAHGNYIGWCPDTMVFYANTTELAYYYVSMSSMPQIQADNSGNIFVQWASVTNFRDPSNYMLRHIFGRMAYDNGQSWNANFYDLTNAFVYNFEECVFPSTAPSTNDKIYVQFQGDTDAGCYLKGSSGAQGQASIDDNSMIILTPTKQYLGLGIDNGNKTTPSFFVSKNSPNPVKTTSVVSVNLAKGGRLSLELHNVMGQKVASVDKGYVANGAYQFTIDATGLASGVYFYTVKLDKESRTNKMIVE
jgi:hypothetical protein